MEEYHYEKGREAGVKWGTKLERKRINAILQPHLDKCNYKAVNEEDCDVCHWAEQTLKEINSPEIVETNE